MLNQAGTVQGTGVQRDGQTDRRKVGPGGGMGDCVTVTQTDLGWVAE